MKIVLIFAGLLLSINSFGEFYAEDYRLTQVFKSKTAPKERRYLAEFKSNSYNDYSDIVIMFGSKNGKINFKAFPTSLWTYPGATNSGKYVYDSFNAKFDQESRTNFTLTYKRFENITFTAEYSKHDSSGSKKFARNALKTVIDHFNKVTSLSTPYNIFKFKELLVLELFKSEFMVSEDSPFPTYDLQIESYVDLSFPNKSYASVQVKDDGSDLISKNFREAKEYVEDTDEAENVVYELIDQLYNDQITYDEFEENQYASAYSKNVSLIKEGPIKRGAKKFVRYEITNTTGFECEDGYYIWTEQVWVLTDGSIFKYSPGTECD